MNGSVCVQDTAVAVVGMGCRFAGVAGVEEFWASLTSGTDAVTEIPADRFDITPYYAPEPGVPGRTVSRHGGFLDDVFRFDAAFFGIAPVEARGMDPQQRVLLEIVWEALEAAHILPSGLAGSRTGVFIGQATAEYGENGPSALERDVRSVAGSRLRAVTAGRVSYALDLRGPSVVLDTACSSSLVAVHAARQSLLCGESDLAIAGGVNVILSPYDAIAYSQGAMLSPSGRCRFGSADADGFVRSEGVGVVVLQRLSDALRQGNPVLALLAGSAVTNDGRGSGLLLKPSVDGQVQMLREACRSAHITPGRLDYVEAHGTGTPVGDGVELKALAAAVAQERSPDRPLLIGSVKTNIGHAEAAAGIAGLIKSVLIVRHGVVPASLHQSEPHPLLRNGALPLELVRENRLLPRSGDRAFVGVSCFGLSGTNAHVVVAEYVPEEARIADGSPPDRGNGSHIAVLKTATAQTSAALPSNDPTDGPHLLIISAKSRAALLRLAGAYAEYLSPGGAGRDSGLRDLCATMALRREAHPYRLWVVGDDHDDLADKLRALTEGRPVAQGGIGEACFGAPRRAVFVFPGQGSQWVGMGRGLYERSTAFRAALDACDGALRAELGWSVVEFLHTVETEFPSDVERVQPALWAVQVALAAAWRERGIDPDVCMGHSMGEVAAAHVAGALSLADAAAVITRRSRLMLRTAGRGAMLATELSGDDARRLVAQYGDAVCVAAENAPTSTVLAGTSTVLACIAQELRERAVLCRPVKVNVASHSPFMDELRDDLLAQLAGLSPRAVTIPLISTVKGAAVSGPELDAPYWADNLRQPVLFTGTVDALAREQGSVFVEVSPHPVLVTGIEETLTAVDGSAAVSSLRRHWPEEEELACAVGRFFAAGGVVHWDRWYRGEHRLVPLPTYPWDGTDFRHVPARLTPALRAPGRVSEVPFSELGISDWGGGVRLGGMTPVPPVVYAAMLLRFAEEAAPGQMFALSDVLFGDRVVDLADADDLMLRMTAFNTDADGTQAVTMTAYNNRTEEEIRCLTARLEQVDSGCALMAPLAVDRALARCRQYVSKAAFRAGAIRLGVEISQAFEAVEQLWRCDGEAVARMQAPKVSLTAAWESALQPLLAARPVGRGLPSGDIYVPLGFGRVELYADLPDEFWTVCSLAPIPGTDQARGEATVLSRDGAVLARFSGIRLRRYFPHLVDAAITSPAVMPVRSWLGHAVQGVKRIARPGRLTAQPNLPSVTGPQAAAAVRRLSAAEGVSPQRGRKSVDTRNEQAGGVGHGALCTRAAALLGMEATQLDGRRTLRDWGLDSLMAVRLSQQLRRECGIEISAGRLLGNDTLDALEASLALNAL
ncbi:type I polyketide synthase [Streptomyces sp. LaPpAH-108]|uniref:type I polyketide synthase n=1 Tax=Streptomyces sp. LaPpAH-108 TaxID=1155714 RepID=UPI00039D78C5|nr:type I polyketide synthase [Streptomyces sp. LaPpAH-108]